jgi:hypothetical protein
VRRIAEAGRLRVGEERAARLIHAAGSGTVFSLIAVPPDQRDPEQSRIARESIIATVTTDPPRGELGGGSVGSAVALRAALPGTAVLSAGERALLGEWLDRIVAAGRLGCPRN